MPPEDSRIWTLVVRGITHLSISVKGNPEIRHEGGTSVHHLILREDEVHPLRGAIVLSGNRVEIRPMAGQTKDQERERSRLNTLAQEKRVWPSVQCPTCPWFDPLLENPCGAESWPPESIKEMFSTSLEAQDALLSCTIQRLTEPEKRYP